MLFLYTSRQRYEEVCASIKRDALCERISRLREMLEKCESDWAVQHATTEIKKARTQLTQLQK